MFLAMLSGCTAKFAYNNLDWLAYWYIDDYIEFTDKQEAIVDQKLVGLLHWHQQQELPIYLSHLKELTADITDQNINVERLTYHQDKFVQHWHRLRTKMIPDLVALAPLMSDKQIVEFFDTIDDQNNDLRDELSERLKKTPQQQKKIALKERTKNLKRWLGALTPEQEVMIEGNYGQYYANRELWLAYRVRYQRSLRSLFEQPDRGESFQSKLTELLMHPEVFKGQTLTHRNDENALKLKHYIVTLISTLTAKQRKHIVEEITDFSEDIVDILG